MANKKDEANMKNSKVASKRITRSDRTSSNRTVTLNKDGDLEDEKLLDDVDYQENADYLENADNLEHADNLDGPIQNGESGSVDGLDTGNDTVVTRKDEYSEQRETFEKDEDTTKAKGGVSPKSSRKSDKIKHKRGSLTTNNVKKGGSKLKKRDASPKNENSGIREKSNYTNKYNKPEQKKGTKRDSLSKGSNSMRQSYNRPPFGKKNSKEERVPREERMTREEMLPKGQAQVLDYEEDYPEEYDDMFQEQQGYRYNDDDGRFDMIHERGDWEDSENKPPVNDQSEIPVLYDEEDDNEMYHEQRPYTDTMGRRHFSYYPGFRRYESENDPVRINYRDPAHKKMGRSSGALVRFFRNGDPNDKGVPITVNRRFINLEALLVYLGDKITTPTGVKHVFKWPEGKEIKSVTEFRNRCVYVVSSKCKLDRNVDYGCSREGFWSNKKPSAGLRKHELGLYKRPISPRESPTRNTPLVVTIINNVNRDLREKVILNPNTQETFEEWLEYSTNSDIHSIFSDKPPYQQIKSFSHLFRELKNHSNFLACGDEMVPLEITKKRQAPSSNSSTDSINESKGRKKKPNSQNEMGQIYENGRRPESPTSTAMSRYDTGPRYPPPYGTRGRLESRRNTKDRVEIEIDNSIREFYPPTYIDPQDDGTKPQRSLKCEWVYGFKGRDAHHNMIVLPSGELVYYVAAIVVLYDKDRDKQRQYCKHNEEVTCMSLHPKRNLIATGQMHGKEPDHASHIRIWDAGSLSTYSVIGLGVFYGGILSIGFCMDGIGNFMCVLDGSEKHVLSVWDWQSSPERVVARTTTSTDPVHCACFYPDGPNNSLLVTYGVRHIYFWKIFYDIARKKEAKILRDRNSGIFENDIPDSVNCLVFLPSGDVVTGDSTGNLMVWERDRSDAFTCKFVVQGHSGTIMAMCILDDGTLLTSAGSEIKAWDTDGTFKAVKTRTIPQEAGNIRSLVTQTPGGMDGKLYVGTSNSSILDGSLQLKFRYLVQGHTDGVWGVVPHPFEPTFVSAGYDQVVYKWSLVNHKVIWRAHVEAPCTALAIDHRQELIAIGTSDGTFIVLNSYNGMHIATVEVGTSSVGCLNFSPDGALLAMGCDDGLISVYAIHDRGQTYRRFNMELKGHNSGVSKLDWSKDGRCIQSVSVDHELLFWDIDSMQMIKIPRMMRDVDWFTNTCHVAFPLIGPWTNLAKDEVIKVVNRSNYRDLLVTGDSKGRIRLYKYPCSKERAEFRGTRVYSSDVTAVAFTPHNSHVLSCGGFDATLVQWQLVED